MRDGLSVCRVASEPIRCLAANRRHSVVALRSRAPRAAAALCPAHPPRPYPTRPPVPRLRHARKHAPIPTLARALGSIKQYEGKLAALGAIQEALQAGVEPPPPLLARCLLSLLALLV